MSKTLSQILAEIPVNVYSNLVGGITAVKLQTVLTDIANSANDIATLAGTSAGTTAGTAAGTTAGAAAGTTAGTAAANILFSNVLGGPVAVEGFGAISGTNPANAAANTTAFNNAFAAGRHVTMRAGNTYVVNAIYIPATATGLSGKATLQAGPNLTENAAVINIYSNTAGFTIDGPTINALSVIAYTTGTVTASSTTITGLSTTVGLVVGQLISGPRIPAGSSIVSINTGAGSLVIDQTPFDFPTGSITGTIAVYHKWDAIGYSASDDLTVRNTTLNGRHGVVGSNSNRVNIHHNTVNGYLISAIEANSISGGAHVSVKQNDNIIFGDLYAYFGIVVNGCVDAQVNRNIIRGLAVHPIFISGVSQAVTTFQVMENIIHGSLNEGLFFCGNLSDGIISGNMETLYGSIDNGISIDASGGYTISDLLVSNNHIESPGVVGIFLGEVNSPGSHVYRVFVTGNKIVNPNSDRDDGFEHGIQLYGAGAQLITVANNHITNYTGRMRYNVGEVANTDGGHPDANIIGPNTGAAGTSGSVLKLGASTLVYATPLAP